MCGNVVEWLERRAYNQHGRGSKPTCAILLCSWERHFAAIFPPWQSWQAVLTFSHISIKLKNKLKISSGQQYHGISFEAGLDNCLLYEERLRRFPASQEDKYRDKIK